MYFEEIEQWTRGELSSHLMTMLATEQAIHPDNIPLLFPVAIDTSSVVGGNIGLTKETLPQYTIACQQKEIVESGGEDLFVFDYLGQITIFVGSTRGSFADAAIRRHAKVVERWIGDHLNPQEVRDLFTIYEMRYSSTVFSGSMPMESENINAQTDDPDVWIAGAEVNLAWRLIESGPRNVHA